MYKVGDKVFLKGGIKKIGRLKEGVPYQVVKVNLDNQWLQVDLPRDNDISGLIYFHTLRKPITLTPKDLLGEEL
jgi:hypothetical protein